MSAARRNNLIRNILIILISVGSAVLLERLGIFHTLLTYSRQAALIGNFIAGFFFTSVLTTGPAAIALKEIATTTPLLQVAVIAAIGSMMGDLILFLFLRNKVESNFVALLQSPKAQRWIKLLHLDLFRWALPFFGALLLASPLPDEVGLSVIGISKIKTSTFMALSYCMNVINIILIVTVIRVLT